MSKIMITSVVVAWFVAISIQGSEMVPVVPWAEVSPTVDADFEDPCWQDALVLTNFTPPRGLTGPSQPMEVRLAYNALNLFLAVTCNEADTNQIVATRIEEDDCVWCDDSFEVWVRDVLDRSRFDQFITSPLGTRQSELKPLPNGTRIRPQWRVASAIREHGWVAELAIPFSDLGREHAPVPGEAMELKLGREDYSQGSPRPTYAIWPPGVNYGGLRDYGLVYFGRVGLLVNPTFMIDERGRPKGWSDASDFVHPRDEDGEAVAVFTVPGRYTTIQQMMRLPRNRLFSVTFETRGLSGGYLRARTPDELQPMVSIDILPSEDWVAHELLFRTDASGRASLLVGCTDDHEPGTFRLRRLRLDEVLMREVQGQAIPVHPDLDDTFVIKALPVSDSRVVRGFCGPPVDGSVRSWDWAMRPWEYNMPGLGTGVRYDYLNNDGLHITLDDDADKGVHAIQVWGGVHARIVSDCGHYDDPESGTTVAVMAGRAESSLAYFKRPVKSSRFSFFDVRDGQIADLGFYRTGDRVPRATGALRYAVGAGALPGALTEPMTARFKPDARTTYALHPWFPYGESGEDGLGTNRVMRLTVDAPIHLVSAPMVAEQPLCAVVLRAVWLPESAGTLLTFQVQDGLSPNTALMTVTVALEDRGELDLVFDFPDQVFEPGSHLWVSLMPSAPITLKSLSVEALETSREEAVKEALPFQLLRMRDHFSRMSEARPWTTLRDREETYTRWAERVGEPGWGGIEPLLRTLAHCRRLDPDDPVSREYDAWIHRVADARAGKSVLRKPHIDDIPDAPRWATVARAAWMHARAIPAWWFTHRATPNGELGTWASDDTDMFQNLVNFPMLERDGVGGDVLDQGARLMQMMLDKGMLEEGLNASREDPLHAYEEGINQQAVLPWLFYGDPVYLEQCMVAARSTEVLTTVNAAGHRHFKSRIVSSADLRNTRADEIDGSNHAQLMHPVQAVAWYNRNPRASRFLKEYCDAWHAHMHTRGHYPTMIETATDRELDHAHEPYREGMAFQMSVMMTAVETLQDSKYLEPVLDFLTNTGRIEFLNGYLLDLDQRGYLSSLPDSDAQLRRQEPILAWHRQGDKQAIMAELETAVAELQTFPRMYTTAEPFTDRVFLKHDLKLTAYSVAYTGGYASRNKSFQSHAVSWEGFGTNYAALVRHTNTRGFMCLLYNFSSQPMDGVARFWVLEHGRYRMDVGVDSDGDDEADTGVVSAPLDITRGDPVPLRLAPRAVTVLKLVQEQVFDDLFDRADLALSAREVTVVGETVHAVAHNIGNRAVDQVVVALVGADGVQQTRLELGPLEAPLDLVPRRIAFAITGLAESHDGWQLVIDSDHQVRELTEVNNAVPIP